MQLYLYYHIVRIPIVSGKGGGGYFTDYWAGATEHDESMNPIEGKGFFLVENQGEHWYKMLQNGQLTDFGGNW